MDALSREQVRAVDRCAIEHLGIPGILLMENAGRGCADVAEDMLGGAAGRTVAVVAGAGNNGGDGYVIARHLSLRGAKVTTYLVADEGRIAGDAAVNLAVLRALEREVVTVGADGVGSLAGRLAGADLVVDAVGGTGIRGALRGAIAAVVEQINAAGVAVLAVDIPTGLDCDTGEAAGPVVRAARTVTFVARKLGFDTPGSQAYTGPVTVADIGIPGEWVHRLAQSGKIRLA